MTDSSEQVSSTTESRISRRRTLQTIGTGIALGSLGGCLGDGDGGGGDGGGGATTGGNEITLVVTRPGYPDEMPDWLEPGIESFESEYSDVTIEPYYVGHGQKFQDFSTRAASGEQPHVSAYPAHRHLSLQEQTGESYDLEPYLSDSTISANRIVERTKEAFGGTMYGLPQQGGPWGGGMYYHQDLYEEAGLDGPAESFDAWFDTMDTLGQNLDAAPFGLALKKLGASSDIAHWSSFVFGRTGQPLLDGPNGDITFNNEHGIEGTKKWLQMKPYIQEQPASFNRGELRQPFASKDIVQYQDGQWALGVFGDQFDATSEDSTVRYTHMPEAVAGEQTFGGIRGMDSWGVFRAETDQHHKRAVQFIDHMSQPEYQIEWAEWFRSVPVYEFVSEEADYAQSQIIEDMLEVYENIQVAPFHTQAGEVIDTTSTTLQKIWFEEVSVEEGLNSIAETVNNL
ncbi:ABC transporter substrate-binding protein [Halobium palmae]|uniref:ABC transporter substrate-binding protein n=1 Tax=Halobium palmae TaxID=1776492 RepID=A0ABD5RVV9_9EURY